MAYLDGQHFFGGAANCNRRFNSHNSHNLEDFVLKKIRKAKKKMVIAIFMPVISDLIFYIYIRMVSRPTGGPIASTSRRFSQIGHWARELWEVTISRDF